MADLIVGFPPEKEQLRSTSSTSRKRRVSFSKFSILISTKKTDETVPTSSRWYTDEEIKSFKIDRARMIQTVISSSNLKNSLVFGLEGYLCANSKAFRGGPQQRRKDIQEAVLNEQHRQQSDDVEDPRILAKVSKRASRLCRKRAHVIGLIHAASC